MKKLLVLLCAITAVACKNTTTTTSTTTTDSTAVTIARTDTTHELLVLDSVLKQFETPAQIFKAPINHVVKFTGSKGTVITVDGNDLETISGKPLGNHIDVELKELTTAEELARNCAATVSDGKLLVSGGAYYINMSSGGEQLRLKAGRKLKVQLTKMAKETMLLFYGRKDALKSMNWTPADTLLSFITADTAMNTTAATTNMAETDGAHMMRMNSSAAREIYKEIEVQQLGWINCDRFLNESNLTSVPFATAKIDSVNALCGFLIFTDINSVRQEYFETNSATSFSNIPLGKKAILLVIGQKSGKVYASRTNITAASGQVIPITLKETATKDLPALFKVK